MKTSQIIAATLLQLSLFASVAWADDTKTGEAKPGATTTTQVDMSATSAPITTATGNAHETGAVAAADQQASSEKSALPATANTWSLLGEAPRVGGIDQPKVTVRIVGVSGQDNTFSITGTGIVGQPADHSMTNAFERRYKQFSPARKPPEYTLYGPYDAEPNF
jgi:hypothetical protein